MDRSAWKTDRRRARLFEIIRQKTTAETRIAEIRGAARQGLTPEELEGFRLTAAQSLRAHPEVRPRS